LKILVINIVGTLVGCRTLSALHRCGFDVDLFGYGDSIFHASDHVANSYKVEVTGKVTLKELVGKLVTVISQSSPDFLVCQDSAAFQIVRLIAWGNHNLSTTRPEIVRLARKSIGGEFFCDSELLRRQLPVLLERAGLQAVPQYSATEIGDEEYHEFARANDFNLLLKLEGRQNGQGIFRIQSEAELAAAVRQHCPDPGGGGFTLQRHVDGPVLRHSLVALNGTALAQFTAEQIRTRFDEPFQAPTVVRLVSDRDIGEQASSLVRTCGLSGFLGMDFIRDKRTARSYLIDINPRINSLSHLGVIAGLDLSASLYDGLSGRETDGDQPEYSPGTYGTVFPYEWLRDRNSPYLLSAASDTPWDDVGLLRRILASLKM